MTTPPAAPAERSPASPTSGDGQDAILSPRRLAAVHATGLLDTEAEEPFDRLARLATTLLRTPMSFVTMVDDQRSFWKSSIGVEITGPADRQNSVEESFCQYVVASGEGLVAGDAANHPVTRDNPSIELMGVAAWAGFPVRSPDGEVLGTFCVVDTEPREFQADEIEALASLAEAASAEVALRMTVRELGDITDTLRESLLPPALPGVEGLDLASLHVPADDGHGVLGDFYDAFESTPGHWWFPLGDVCGHGPDAARTTALARWSVRANATRTASLEHVVRKLNRQLLARPEPDAPHLTLVLAAARPSDRSADGTMAVDLAVAGHPPALVLRADAAGGPRVEVVEAGGTALGWFEEIEVGTAQVALAPGDALVLYTDGVIEAGRGHERFDEDDLAAVLEQLPSPTDAAGIIDAIIGAVTAHSPHHNDDIAVVVLRHPTAD